jgi:hypothetical protein
MAARGQSTDELFTLPDDWPLILVEQISVYERKQGD